MWRVTINGLMAHKLRLVLTSLAVVIGVAFMAGTFVLTDTLGSVFDDIFAETTKGVDAVVRSKQEVDSDVNGNQAPRTPLPESLVGQVEDVSSVAAAQGNVQGIAFVVGRDGDTVQHGGAPPLGLSWGPSRRFMQALTLEHGQRPEGPNEVAIDVKTADDAGYRVGDRVPIVFNTGTPQRFRLVGTFKFGESGNLGGATLTAFDIPTAQQLFDRVGQFDSIDVAKRSGVSEQELVRDLRAELRTEGVSRTVEVKTGQQLADEQASDVKQGLSFFNTFLLVFAFISLFVGSFIIYNTFSIIVAQRGRELALLRALGASGQQVTWSVAVEALFVGIFSSVVGLVAGIGFAIGLQGLLSAFGLDLPSKSPEILPRTIIVSLLVGTVVTFVAAISPARRAARVPPIAAMRDTPVRVSSGRRRYRIGALLSLIGVLLLALGLFGNVDSDSFPGGGAGIVGFAAALVFIGVAMLAPLIARPAARVLGWPFARTRGMSGVLARENAMRNPRRTATTASALMIGLALVTLVAVIGSSTKDSFARLIDEGFHADYVVREKGFFGGGFAPELADSIRQDLPDAQVIQFRNGVADVGGGAKQVLGTSPGIQQAVDLDLHPGARLGAFAREGGVILFENQADDLGVHTGDDIVMTFDKTGEQRVPVRGIFAKNNQTLGSEYLLALSTYEDNFVDQSDTFVIVRTAGEATAQDRRIVERAAKPYPNVEVEDRDEFRDSQLAQLDTIINLLYVLLLLSVFIALIGIINTLALSIFERIRELGLLRAVGMTRAQVRRMIRDEAVIISVFGSLLGLAIGLVFGFALVQSLSDSDITFSLPTGQLVVFVILAGLAGFAAGAWPAWRAARGEVLESVSSE